MSLIGNPPAPESELVCERCGLRFQTRLARYWFLAFGLRGRAMRGVRPAPTPADGDHGRSWILCGPCGDRLDRELELYLLSRVKSTGLELVAATGPPS